MSLTSYAGTPLCSRGRPASLPEVLEAQSKLGLVFPTDFIHFAMQVDTCGTVEWSSDMVVHIEDTAYEISIGVIYGIRPASGDTSQMCAVTATMDMRERDPDSGRLHHDFVFICSGDYSDEEYPEGTEWDFVLRCDKEHHGEVWIKWWMYVDECDCYEDAIRDPLCGLFFVASTLREFVQRLQG